MEKQSSASLSGARRGERGIAILETVIIVALIGIVSTFAFFGIERARHQYRLDSAVRELASYLEKTRMDAIKRHVQTPTASATDWTGVSINGSRYIVQMDFD
ncbi:MAG: hypothetical protein M3407_00150, partial [Acidobacteriota bacterium]|nr:hypothetical protein [Acidobacteriota bacterium]